MFSAISAIATLTCSEIAGGIASTGGFWLLFFTTAPCCRSSCRNARPTRGRSQAGDRHFNCSETRENLLTSDPVT